MLQVKVTKMNDLSFKKDLFNPLRTGRKIDEFFSGERGIMPGTNTVITGDPGVGKTTVAFSKNRRGGNMNKFYFNLSTKNQVNWMYEAPANGEA
jgi:predicted ATP-dependent serine protease